MSVPEALNPEIAQAQKMRAIGRFAGGLAHDFNNLLMVTIWNLGLLERSLDSEGEAHRYAKTALSGAQQCAELLRELLVVAAEQPRQLEFIDLQKAMPLLIERMTGIVGPSVEVASHIKNRPMFIHADPTQFEIALLALAANARDAMPAGGKLTVDCARVPGTNAHIRISVSDTGEGMPDEVVERAFEPFFTSRRPSRGRGLGLSKVYGFATQTHGKVKIESTLAVGTTVTIVLPEQNRPA